MTEAVKLCHVIDASTRNPLLFDSIKYSDRQRINYEVVTLSPPGEFHQQLGAIGVPAISINTNSRGQYPSAIQKLVRLFRRELFDIVQVHSFEASLVGLIAATIARVPVRIFSGHHSHEVPLYKNPKLLFVDSFLCRRLATDVLAPSENMKTIFIESQRVPPDRIRVIPHGLDLEEWLRASKADTRIREEHGLTGKIVFGAVGRLFWVKGQDTLIRAFAEIAQERDDVVLLIVGEGPERESIEQRIKALALGNKVILMGQRTDIAAVMATFDALLHPSLAESFGLILVEAMALGKPVAATKFGIAPEVIRDGETGYFFDTDVTSIRDTLRRILSERDRWTAIGDASRAAVQKFSVKFTQAECDEYYLSLAKARGQE